MKDTQLLFTPPAGVGQPSVLDLSQFESLGDFSDALAAAYKAAFPSISLDQLNARAKGDVGFRSIFLPLVALSYRAGETAVRAAAAIEASIATSKAAAAAAAAVKVCTFEDAVREKLRTGASKPSAIVAAIAEFPELHRQFIQQGGGKL